MSYDIGYSFWLFVNSCGEKSYKEFLWGSSLSCYLININRIFVAENM